MKKLMTMALGTMIALTLTVPAWSQSSAPVKQNSASKVTPAKKATAKTAKKAAKKANKTAKKAAKPAPKKP
jgi:hypothetical protein